MKKILIDDFGIEKNDWGYYLEKLRFENNKKRG